jgi:hypothetical protein
MKARPKSSRSVRLDWSRLLGFDQVSRPASGDASRLTDPRLARLGSKIGVKAGVKS